MIEPESSEGVFIRENIPFWKELTETQRRIVLSGINVNNIHRGVQLVRSSSECSGMILLKEGQVRAFLSSEDGREVTLYRLLAGDACIMTAACMIQSVRFQIYLEVEKDVRMFVIPQTIFIRLNSENNAVKDYTMNVLADRFSEAVGIIDKMVFGSVPARIAGFLIEKHELDGTEMIDITHDTIAKNIGTAREVVSRVLKSFENKGIVKLFRGNVTILDIRKLFDLTDS